MEIKCVVNKKCVRKNKALKAAQKSAKKYYPRRGVSKGPGTTKAKIRKLADLNQVEYKWIAGEAVSGDVNTDISKAELISLCESAKLTGRSGNGFPLAQKLAAFNQDGGTLIINGVECDPGLVTDSWIYRNKLEMVGLGAQAIKNALGLNRVVLATKEVLNCSCDLEQVCVIDRFPMGYENYLIQYVTGVQLSPGELPQNRGILVMNLQSVLAVAECLSNPNAGQYKYITVANLFTGSAVVCQVKRDDEVNHVVNECFAPGELEQGKIYAGGGAFNAHQAVTGETISDSIGYIALGQMPDYAAAGNCKGCGACTKKCPAQVSVHKLVQYKEKNPNALASDCKEFNVTACVGCGTCTYGCMAGKDVREIVLWAKSNSLE